MNQGTPKWAVWMPIATASLSGVFAFVGVIVGQSMTMDRERELRHRQFQVEMLLELQDTLTTAYDDIDAHRKRGYVTDDVNRLDHIAKSLLRIQILSTRVDDEPTRLASQAFCKVGLVVMPRYIDPSWKDSKEEIEAAAAKVERHPEFKDAYARTIVSLGEALLELHNS